MAWVFLGMSLRLHPGEIPRKTHAIPTEDEKRHRSGWPIPQSWSCISNKLPVTDDLSEYKHFAHFCWGSSDALTSSAFMMQIMGILDGSLGSGHRVKMWRIIQLESFQYYIRLLTTCRPFKCCCALAILENNRHFWCTLLFLYNLLFGCTLLMFGIILQCFCFVV
jgi:hypothetical protein